MLFDVLSLLTRILAEEKKIKEQIRGRLTPNERYKGFHRVNFDRSKLSANFAATGIDTANEVCNNGEMGGGGGGGRFGRGGTCS